MNIKHRLKSINAGKQSIVRRFDHPPGPGIGKEGDLGVAVIPRKGLHLFYKLGGRWYGVRLNRDFNTKLDDDRVVLSGKPAVENGEISFSGGIVNIKNGNTDAIIKGERFQPTATSGSGTSSPVRGEISYDSNYAAGSINAMFVHNPRLILTTLNTFPYGTPTQLAMMNYNANSEILFYDGVTHKWTMGYDSAGGTTVSDNTCDYSNGEFVISMDDVTSTSTGSTALVVGMVVTGTHVPSNTVIQSINTGADTFVISNETSTGMTSNGLNQTLTFTPLDGKFKIDRGVLADTSDFMIDTSGNVLIANNLTSSGNLAAVGLTLTGDLAVNGDDITSDGDLTVTTASGDFIVKPTGGGDVHFNDGVSSIFNFDVNNAILTIYDDADTDGDRDSFKISVGTAGVTTFATNDDSGSAGAHLYLNIEGGILIEADSHVQFDNCGVGFDKATTTFAAAAVTSQGDDSTDIDFRLGNKHELTLTDDIAGSGEHINMVFPDTSGNFILVLIQGNASSTVLSDGWKAYASDASLCDNTLGANGTDGEVRWAGGTAPTLTTTQYKSDIVSIYWDADNQTACCTITQNF